MSLHRVATAFGLRPTTTWRAARHSLSSSTRFRPNLELLGDRVVPAAGSISGQVFQDATGNGLTSDDTALRGVTVSLYRDCNHDGVLSGGDRQIASATSNGSGFYIFNNLRADTYFVSERTPSGFVRTAPALGNYNTINLADGQRVTDQQFDNYRKPNASAVSNFSFTITSPDGTQRTVTDLRGNTNAGDTVTANFTVMSCSPVVVSLVSYNAPGSSFDPNTASQQKIFEVASGTFGRGRYSLTVHIPSDNYQIDFVAGAAIDHFGPAGSNIFYSRQCRLLSADNDGPTTPPPPTGSISGGVYVDINQDGITDASAGDGALAGVEIDLYSVDANGEMTFVKSTTTGADGSYLFGNLPAGTYVLDEMQPRGHDDGKDYLGTVGGVIMGNMSANDEFSEIVIAAGQQGVEYDFTEFAGAAKLTGSVGIPDENAGMGFDPIEGVTVTLQYADANGVMVTLTTQTDSDGNFFFSGLAAGDYTLTEVVPDDFEASSANVGTVDGSHKDGTVEADNITISSIALGLVDTGTGYIFFNNPVQQPQ